MVTPAVKREAVAHLVAFLGVSERRACRIIGCERMTVRYRSRRPETRLCGIGCEPWRMSAGASATGGSMCF